MLFSLLNFITFCFFLCFCLFSPDSSLLFFQSDLIILRPFYLFFQQLLICFHSSYCHVLFSLFFLLFFTFDPSSSSTHAHTLTDARIPSCVSVHLLWSCTSVVVLARCLNLLMQGNQLSGEKGGVTPQPQLSYQTPTHSG